MALLERVESELHRAIKARDDVSLRTLRMLKAALVSAEIAKRPAVFSEADAVRVLRTEVKRRQEAMVDYQRGKRDDLVARESAEVRVLDAYLPAGPDAATIRQAVTAAAAKLSATGPKDFGQVMGAAMQELGGNVDGAVVSQIVKEVLSGSGEERKAKS